MLTLTKEKLMNVIDISIPLQEGMITYPNNPPFSKKQRSTTHSILSEITMGSHTGTHYDFPSHANASNKASDAFKLNIFFQECQVLDLTDCDAKIEVEDLKKKIITKRVVLMKTKNSYTGFKTFYPDYVYLSDTAAEYLATLSLDIVGIDFISVKGMVETSNKAHTTLLSKNILILEGIDLNSVAEGTYFFSGLPLKITDTDGAPARVVIIDNL